MQKKNRTEIIAEPNKQELFIIREFDFPRELVFRAHTDPEIYAKWVGPTELETEIVKWDCRDGGSYHFRNFCNGESFDFFGVNHEVSEPERIIGTFEYSGLPERGHVILGKTTFAELPGGRTRLVHQSVFFSVADRDGMLASGMERGVNEGYEKLDALLAGGLATNASAN
jgi:uncharacterized protein YndB with AHSA1/START domain